jgi:WD40 repeat protein/transcriptional regulator with XRE-family HTH domain
MSNRQRGVVLTDRGQERLEAEIATAQDEEKFGKRFTQAELSERTILSIKTLKKIRERSAPVDEASVRSFFQAFGLALETADYGLPEPPSQPSEPQATSADQGFVPKIDWGEKPDTAIFFGRTEELATLSQWVMAEQCRLVTLLGMGGIGKTSLVAKLADQIYQQFDYVIWRSLREAPPLDEILVRLIQFLSDQQETEINLPSRLGERIIRLLHYLREHRCLLVLDNLESILQAESTGQFRDGYEGYGELIRRIGEAEHQSCLLLTSRECPRELAPMAGDRLPVRLCSISGIDAEAGREILKAKGLELAQADTQSQELIRRYSGNPQALHLVATAIQREFLGDVDDFLEEEGAAVEDVRSLLDQHLTRLAPLERSILFWLAINREPVGLDELMEDLLPPVTKREVRSALRGLRDRYLIEAVDKQFTLQNVIMEFATGRFVEQVIRELETQQLDLFHTHALFKATSKDYIREIQLRLILKPSGKILVNPKILIVKLLDSMRKCLEWTEGYAPGNLINLIVQASVKSGNLDFSNMTVRQAYLNNSFFQDVNLTNTTFLKSSFGHIFQRVYSVACNPNGDLLATGDNTGRVHLWCIKSSQQLAVLQGHTNPVISIAFSPNGELLAIGNEDYSITIWDVSRREQLKRLTGHDSWVMSVSFSPDGQLLATASDDSTIKIWDLRYQKCLHTLVGHTSAVRSVAFSVDGRWLATGSHDCTIRIWDTQQDYQSYALKGHDNWVTAVSFSPDGKLLATSSSDSTIRLWHFREYRNLGVLSGHTSCVRCLVFSPNGKWLFTGSEDTTVRLWDVSNCLCVHTFLGHTSMIWSLAISPNFQWLITSSDDAVVKIWDIKNHHCVNTFTGYVNWINTLSYSPDGKLLATGSHDGIIRLWNPQQKTCIYSFCGHKSAIRSIVFSPDNKWFATGSEDTLIRLWDRTDHQCLLEFSGHQSWILSVAFSPDGKLLASGSADRVVRLWDIKRNECLYKFEGHTNWVRSVAFSPDGRLLATSSEDATVRLWNVCQHACLQRFIGHTGMVWALAFSPDNRLLATASEDCTVRLWDISQRECLYRVLGHTDEVLSVSFSPDSSLLATGSVDASVRLWDIENMECSYTFWGHEGNVRSVVFSPDGKTIASSDSEGKIHLWDIHTKVCLGVLRVTRPFENTIINGINGLSEIQMASLITLGAVDRTSENHQED